MVSISIEGSDEFKKKIESFMGGTKLETMKEILGNLPPEDRVRIVSGFGLNAIKEAEESISKLGDAIYDTVSEQIYRTLTQRPDPEALEFAELNAAIMAQQIKFQLPLLAAVAARPEALEESVNQGKQIAEAIGEEAYVALSVVTEKIMPPKFFTLIEAFTNATAYGATKIDLRDVFKKLTTQPVDQQVKERMANMRKLPVRALGNIVVKAIENISAESLTKLFDEVARNINEDQIKAILKDVIPVVKDFLENASNDKLGTFNDPARAKALGDSVQSLLAVFENAADNAGLMPDVTAFVAALDKAYKPKNGGPAPSP